MISKEDFIVIHSLYKKGKSKSEIAKLVKLDRKTVSKRLKEIELKTSSRVVTKPSKLEPYKEYIRNFIRKDNHHRIPYSVILEDIKSVGYTGGRSILQDFLTNEYRCIKLNVEHDPVVRFETLPGEQMQIDWTFIRTGRNPIYAFVATLGYSRSSFVHFTTNIEDESLLKCHELAFLYFDGVTKNILYDNMKSVVIRRDAYGKGQHDYNDKLLDLSKRYGFTIKLCRPYRAKTKGKVERFNSYLKSNFYYPTKIKLIDAGLEVSAESLNQHISSWLIKANARIHATTKMKPSELLLEEQPHLIKHNNFKEINSVNTVNSSVCTIQEKLPIRRSYAVPHVEVNIPKLRQYDSLLAMGCTGGAL